MNAQFVITGNPSIDKILNNRIFQHVGYWFGLILFFGFFWGFYDLNYYRSFRNEIISLPIKAAIVYFIINFLLPKFLYKKRYKSFILLLLLSLGLGGLCNHAIFVNFIYPYDPRIKLISGDFEAFEIMHRIVDINTVLLIPFVVKLLKKWYKNQRKNQILKNEKLEAELNFLKNQVHPHFLFNTLNNLQSLIVKKSDLASEVVIKLSDLLRYMLYEAKADQIALSKEVQYIKNYISLEKVRYGDRIDVSFHTYGDIGAKYIAPMLILPFIENCFKHSAIGETEQAWATISISIKSELFKLKVENSVSGQPHETANLASGIGLQNVKRRLELLYPDNHALKIERDEDSYLSVLKINL